MQTLKAQRMTWGQLGRACLQGKKYGQPTKVFGETLILYHGTRAPLEKIMKEGLLIRAGRVGNDTRMQMIDEVLEGEFGVTRDQVPEWVWRYEWEYEKTIEPHLHFSVNVGTAAGYSHQGCEIKACVRGGMYSWLLTRRYGEDISFKEIEEKFGVSPNRLACKMNGKESHVFCVEVPKDYVREEDLNRLIEVGQILVSKFDKKEQQRHLSSTTKPAV